MQPSERYQKGWEKLKEVDGEAVEKVCQSLREISPDLAKFIIEYSFGDIYSRDGLELRLKEIAVVAALTVMGTAQPQLKVHLQGALNTGNTINEVKEVILQMSGYGGFPSCINAMAALKEVLAEREERGIKDNAGRLPTESPRGDRLRYGEEELSRLDALQPERLRSAFGVISPELVRFTLEYGYADVYSRDNLGRRERQIATIAALTAMGNAEPQLRFHVNAGLNVGLTIEEIREVMLLMTVYAGFPAAINGTNILKEVVNGRPKPA
ncbi:MAG: carboxymuconolactone decarboxylase family protein [Fibrobacteres bacterium]|nr:carboxymuconolactone decarboxylase family protein [Fibrobacterota bacterium]